MQSFKTVDMVLHILHERISRYKENHVTTFKIYLKSAVTKALKFIESLSTPLLGLARIKPFYLKNQQMTTGGNRTK